MKLAIVSDRDGAIIASAVCQVIFDGDVSNPMEATVFGRPCPPEPGRFTIDGGPESGTRSDIVEAPAFMQDMKHDALHGGLQRIHESMRLHSADNQPVLRDLIPPA
jgi:hypothetical protein